MRATQGLVIVTGASGFIGSALVERLAKEFHVVGFDKNEPANLSPCAEFVRTDLTSDESVRGSLEHVRYKHGDWITSVIHLADHPELSAEPDHANEEVAVRNTDRLLHDLQRFRLEQFVFSSTICVYAPTEPGRPINEASPVDPKWDYLKSKIKTGRLIRERRGDMQTAVLRMAGVYDDHCHSPPLAGQMQRIFERKLMSRVFPGDTSHGQAYVHLEDLVDALARVVSRRWALPSELTLILGESETLSYEDLQNVFGSLIHNEEWPTKEIPKSSAKTGTWLDDQLVSGEQPFINPCLIDSADDHYELDISLARALLDWQPHHTLRETVPKMVSALKSDTPGWYRAHKLEPPRWMEECSESSTEKAHACSG